MKYFEVIAKCGHVGRDRYYEGHFFLRGKSKREVAAAVKAFPRVKKNHEDAILDVIEISEERFIEGNLENAENPYFKCKSKREQNAVIELIEDKIFPETELQLDYRKQRGFACDKKKKRHGNFIRNPYKYAKYNAVREIELAWA